MRREAAGDVAQRGFDLARRDVRARGLDHVAAPAVEVEEAVGVDVEQVTGTVPAVGREDLEALAPVVALHERRARGTRARRSSPTGDVLERLGVDDPRRRGRGPAARTNRAGARAGRSRRRS